MNRNERRAAASEMRKRAATFPEHLVEMDRTEWPSIAVNRNAHAPSGQRVQQLWRSRLYLVTRYDSPPLNGIEVRRLTVNRVTMRADGNWDQDIPWEDLQRCKRETGHGDWYGVEIYPRDRDIVNVANMRHLWLIAEPLDLGWFSHAP